MIGVLPFYHYMPRSKSSKRWLEEHFKDPFVKKAQAEGKRSRAIYKLQEIDEKVGLFKPGMTVVDLGAAPGGWTQYVSERLKGQGKIVALDLLPMDAFPDVTFIQGDFQEEEIFHQLLELVPKHSVDVVLSDIAPNMSGVVAVDIPRAMYLAELVFDLSHDLLKPGGTLLMKIFHGSGCDELIKQARQHFKKVSMRKPSASRSRSRESYLLAKDYNL